MAYSFDIVGWQDWNNDRYVSEPDVMDKDDRYEMRPLPDNPEDAHGCWVHFYNPEQPEDQSFFWIYSGTRFQDWAEWLVYIGGFMVTEYGLALADE